MAGARPARRPPLAPPPTPQNVKKSTGPPCRTWPPTRALFATANPPPKKHAVRVGAPVVYHVRERVLDRTRQSQGCEE